MNLLSLMTKHFALRRLKPNADKQTLLAFGNYKEVDYDIASSLPVQKEEDPNQKMVKHIDSLIEEL